MSDVENHEAQGEKAMSQGNTGAFLVKMSMIGGVVMFVLTDIVLFIVFRKNPNHSLSVGPLGVYTTCFVACAPLFVGTRGFFLVHRLVNKLVSNPNENDMKALKSLSNLFSLGVIAAYLALITVVAALLPNLRR